MNPDGCKVDGMIVLVIKICFLSNLKPLKNKNRNIMKVKNLLFFLFLTISACTANKKTKEPLKYSDRIISTPEKFVEGIISTDASSEFDICFTPDGKTAFFTRRIGSEKQKIWQSTYENGEWTSPTQLPFSTDRDETPFFSQDGKILYFGSARPIPGRPSKGNFDMNIWQAEWVNNEWGNPIPLNSTINSVQEDKEEWPSSNENFIFSLDNENFIFTTMLRGEKVIEVYTTTKNGDEFTKPEKIKGLFQNDNSWKYSAVLSPDGQYLLFNSYEAEGGVGGEDIFISKKTSNGWSRAKSIGNLVNTKAEEGSPRFSPDGNYFFFGREYKQNPSEDGVWNVFFIETAYLNIETLFED
jgi:Tol biopolymer transport system component